MATTPQTVYEPHTGAPSDLQEKARRHLWMHFTRMGAYDEEHEIPIIVRGEGSYVYDEHDKRYLDGLSALFCVNAGHGRAEMGEAAAAPGQEARLLHELELRAPDGDRAGRARGEPRARRPQPRLLHLGRLGGGGVGLEAGAPVPQAHAATRPRRRSSRARRPTTAPPSARSRSPASRRCARRSSRSCRAPTTCRTRTTYRWPEDRDPLWAADQIEHMIEFQGPETVAAVILEPVQNSGGCFVPAGRLLAARPRDLRQATTCC